MQNLLRCLVMASTVFWAGCAEKSPSATSTNATNSPSLSATTTNKEASASVWNPTRAQPKLRTMKLYVGREVIAAELALTETEVRTGMMFRTSMKEEEGMLFVF